MIKFINKLFFKNHIKGVSSKVLGLLMVGLFMFSADLSATHIVGGGLTYRCLGGDQYEVTLNVYRDCFFGASDAQFDDPVSIGIFDGQSNFRIGEVRIPLGIQNDTLDIIIADTCLFVPASVCVHTTTYIDTISLPERPGGYTLAYQRCCRNQTIVNIINPLETGATFISTISNDALQECNAQATFNNFPPLFICVNEPVDFDHSATDTDGDSLVYKLCAPFTGATLDNPQPQPPSSPPYDPVIFNAPTYGLSNLLGGDPLVIDPNTGFMTGVPNTIGQFVVGVCVEEYRNGVLIAETRRDFQYNVGECGIVEAVIGNANTLCDDLTANFINNSTNAGTFHWDFGDPTTTNDVSTEFQPSYTYPDTGMYNVVLTVEIGNECEDVLNFPLYVKEVTAQASFNAVTFQCENGDIIVAAEDTSFDSDSRFDIIGWNWTTSDGQFSDEQHPVFVVSNTGEDITLTLEVESNDTCSDAISQTFSPGDNNLGSLLSPSTICDGQSVELYPEFLTLNQSLTYSWSPSTNLSNPNIANPSANPTSTTTYTLTVNAPSTGCTALIDKVVNVGDFTDLSIGAVLTDDNGNQTVVDVASGGDLVVCDGQDVTLTVTNSGSNVTTVEWVDQNGNIIGSEATITVNPNGSITYTVSVVDENGCNGQASVTVLPSTVNINVEEITNPGSGSGITDIDGDGTLDLCVGETSSLNINNLNSGDQLTYQWTAANGVIIAGADTANPTIFGLAEGIYTLDLLASNQFGCSSRTQVMISVHEITDLEIQTTITDLGDNSTTTVIGEDEIINCEGDNSTIILSETSTSNNGNVSIVWTDENGNVIGNGPTVDVSPFGNVTYMVTITDQFGCSASEEITIVGNPVDITLSESTTGGGNGGELTDSDGDGDLDLCIGLTGSIDVGNNNAGDNLTYQWSGDVIIGGADTANPSIAASTPGQYLITLVTTNQYGCTRIDIVDVDIFDPNASLDFETEQDCAGTTLTFNSGNTNFEFYTWDFGDGAGSTLAGVQSPSWTYSAPGVYEVTLSPIPGLPCDLPSMTTTVEVAETLVDINFEVEFVECTPGSVTISFTDVTVTQIGMITDREWEFSNNGVSSAANPTITVTEEGPLTVTLTVLNSANCDGSATQTFDIDFIDVSGIQDEIIACPLDGPVQLNSAPDNSLQYEWSPSAGLDDPTAANPTADPSSTTTYTVVITDNSSIDVCEVSTAVTVVVPDEIGIGVDAEGTSSGEFEIDETANTNTIVTCEAETITLTTTTSTGSITDFDIVWTNSVGEVISDLGSIDVQPGATETFTVTYTDEFGCSESQMITVEGGPVDIAIEETFTNGGGTGITGILNDDGFLELCTGESFEINVNNLDPVDNLTYAWTGDGQIILSGANTNTPTINSSEAGTFILFLDTENQFGCTQRDTIDVNVIDSNADLAFDEIKDCNGVTVIFTNTSTGNNDDYIWDFGDPSNPNASSSEANPTYTYPGVGTYTVTLGLNTGVTCVDDHVQVVEIVSPILASNFTFDYIDCSEEGVIIQFTEQSINPQDNTTGYLWDFGNGMTSTDPNPVLSFDEDEELNVTLTIFTEIDCESSSQVQNVMISIIDDIEAPASILACENNGPQIIDLNSNPNYLYEWSPAAGLDDPTSPTPIADPGVSTTYSVTITDIAGSMPCSTVREVEIFVPESIDLTVPDDFDTDCGDEATLTVTANNDGLDYEWTLDEEVLGNDATLELDGLSGPNVFVVTATDANGCQQTASVTVTGTQLDVDINDLQFLCEGENGQLDVITSNDPNDILTVNWVGPNIISGGNTLTPIINTDNEIATTYFVEIENQFGCDISDSIRVVVLDDAPLEDLVNYGQCEDLTISFFNNSPNAPFYTWDFGDGSPTVMASNPMHTYDEPGTYSVTLSLPNSAQCADGDIASFTFPVLVEADINFVADFDLVYDQCDSAGQISFMDLSSSSNQGQIVAWDWTFSTPATSTEQNPTIDVGESQVITVTLTVTTDAECTATVTRDVPITLIDTEVQLADQLQCIGLETELNPNPNTDFSYAWSPSDGLSDPNSPNPTVISGTTTTYTVTITSEEQACSSLQEVTLTVPEVIDLQVSDDVIGCESVVMDITASSDVDVDYVWTLNGTTPAGNTGTIEAETDRPNIYTVVATDEFGCSETETVTFADFQILAGLSSEAEILCLGNEIELPVSIPLDNDDIFTFEWVGDDLDLTDPSTPIANPTSSTVYQVTISNEQGCSNTQFIEVDVVDIDLGLGNALADPDTIFIGNSTQLSVSSEEDLNFIWTNAGTLNDDSIADPLASPTDIGETEYTVTVTDENGCVTTRTVTVVVLSRACEEPFIFFPNAFSPNNDGENDELRVRANENFIDEVYWIVYNRWGEKVFESNSINETWDGRFNDELVSPDAYGYYLRVNCTGGETFEKRGNVTVLR